MKKFCISFLFLSIITLSICLYVPTTTQERNCDYLRIHVRANSNREDDQNVKYKVKDEVVNFLTPYVATCTTKEQSLSVISHLLGEIERVCEQVLHANGFFYSAKATVNEEFFPTRIYDDNITLEQGFYDALIINLGEGIGDNWWCVIYPPLCFSSGGANFSYRSAILDVINAFFN